MTIVYTNPVAGYNLAPILSPAPGTDPAALLGLQTPPTAPNNDTLTTGTNLLHMPPSIMNRLRSFPEEVYTLNPTDHLTKFLKVLLGDAGAGQLKKQSTIARLGAYLQGANFYDLDKFYGALFGIVRNSSEQLPVNPYTDVATSDTWATVRSLDSHYRARIDAFGKAVSFGASAIGMELMAEAILQTPCDVYESWRAADAGIGLWSDLETLTWTELEAYTWAELASLSEYPDGSSVNRKVFTVVPHRAITLEEDYDLRRVLNVLKPADTILLIDDAGSDSATEVTLRGVYADSEWWELVESVIPNPTYSSYYKLSDTVDAQGFRELLRPSGTEYQGEQINYGGDIIGVSGYDTDTTGKVTANPVIEAYTFADGTILYYPPSQALATRFFSLAGRYVSDAVLQGAPFSNDPNNVAGGADNPLMDLYVDGMPIDTLVAGLETPNVITNLGIEAISQRFWSTPPRLNSDDTIEILDIHLVGSRLVNTLTFQVAHYPQYIQVQTYDTSNATWNTIWSQYIYDSIPGVLAGTPPISHSHPQHPDANWDTFDLTIPATMMTEIRIVLQRITGGTPPVQAQIAVAPTVNGAPRLVSVPVAYSLGIQNFALGYEVARESDLPSQPIITRDALGSQIEFTSRFEVAENTINNGDIPWRCAPQPTADSVVNFYVDTRDVAGTAQLIDKIFMDPLYLGPHCNLYYSDDDTIPLVFAAEATNIVSPNLQVTGLVVPYGSGLAFDSQNPSYVTIDNLPIQYNPQEPWWVGVAIQPNFASQGATSQVLWQFGDITITLDPDHGGTITLTSDTGTASLSNVSWAAGATIYITVAFFPVTTGEFNAGMYLFFNNNNPILIETANLIEGRIVEPPVNPVFSSRFQTGGFSTSFVPSGPQGAPPTTLVFGNNTGHSGPPANLSILSVVLKQTNMHYADINGFFRDYNSYSTLNGGSTENAILRFNIDNVSNVNQYGWLGGPGDFYELLNWTPVMRDYILAKGYMEFPPVSAKFFKLEFTNLIAQSLPTLVPITKTVKQHYGLSQMNVQQTPIPAFNNPGQSIAGAAQAITLASELNFADALVLTTGTQVSTPPTTPVPTSVQTAQDIATQAVLANSAWYYRYQTWAAATTAPRFVRTGVHSYASSTVVQDSQVSYYVGLNTISIYRSNFSGDNDARIYDEAFIDDVFLTTVQIDQNPGDVNTVGMSSFPVHDESAIYHSSTPVYGVQFATIQSDPIEIAYNDDFGDPAIAPPYNWQNTAQPHLVGDALVQLQANQTVKVTRNTQSAPPPKPSFDGIVDPIPYPVFEENSHANEVEALTADIATYSSQPGVIVPGYLDEGFDYGGLATAYANTPMGGTVYAAIRLSTNDVFATPLSLEIVDINSLTVVATVPVNCAPNQTVEVYLGYILGSVVTAGGPLEARIVQYGGAKNTWIVDRFSLFLDAWVWEWSNNGGSTWVTAFNVKDNAYGMLTFPEAGNELRWRVTAWAPNLHLHYLRTRPVYNGFLSDEPLGVIQGPNQSVFDHIPPIYQDPFFTGWTKPIPYGWFAASQEYPILGIDGTPTVGPYSRFYTRSVSENLTGQTEGIVRTVFSERGTSDSYPVSDSVSRTLDTAERETTDTTTTSSGAVAIHVVVPDTDAIVEPPVTDLPNPG